MDLATAFTAIESALNEISGYGPDCILAPRSAENAIRPGKYLWWVEDTVQQEGGDIRWIEPGDVRANLICAVYIDSTPSSPIATDLLTAAQAVKDKIKALTGRSSTDFRCRVIDVSPIYGEQLTWGAVACLIQVGDFN